MRALVKNGKCIAAAGKTTVLHQQDGVNRYAMVGNQNYVIPLKRDVNLSDYISVKDPLPKVISGSALPDLLVAVGDGVADDRNAINNAIAWAAQNGKNVLFPAGKYFVGNYISANKNGVDIYCDPLGCEFFGNGSYIIQFSAGNISAYFNGSKLHGKHLISHTLSCGTNNCQYVNIYDPVIVGTSHDHDGIYIGSGASHVSVYGGNISGASRCGIAICDAKHTLIDGVTISDVVGGSVEAGIDVEANTYNANENNIIRNCTIFDCERIGISNSWGVNTLIEGCRIYNIGGTGIVSGISGAQWKDPARVGYDKMFVSNFDEDGFITLDAADDAVIEVGAWMRLYCDTGYSPPTELTDRGYYYVCQIDPDNRKRVRIGTSIKHGVIESITSQVNPDGQCYFFIQNPEQGSDLVIRGNTIEDTRSYGIDIRNIMRVRISHNTIRRTGSTAIGAVSYQSCVENNLIEDVVGNGISVATESMYNRNTIRGCTSGAYSIPQYRINATIANTICEDVASASTYAVQEVSGAGTKINDCVFRSNGQTLKYGLVVKSMATGVVLENVHLECTPSIMKYLLAADTVANNCT